MRWRFTDKALHFAPWESILTLKAGSLEEYSLLERWGEPGRAPAALLLAGCVESARWLVEASSAFAVSCELQAIDFWRAPPGLAPGERFCAFLWIVERNDNSLRLALRQRRLSPGEVTPELDAWQGLDNPNDTDDTDDVDGLFTCAFAPLAAWHAPAERAALWREMRA
jgi:hypothetical protein